MVEMLSWNVDPLLIGALALTAWAYGLGIHALWQRAGRGRGVTVWQAGAFFGGLCALAVALVSPLEALSGLLFSAHMAQHLLLIVVAAPLLVWGATPTALAWAVPRRRWRQALGRWWQRQPLLQAVWHLLTLPWLVWFLYALCLWVWHFPAFYEAALRTEWVHILEHGTFLGTAALFWWTLMRRQRQRHLGSLTGLLFVFTTGIHSSLLGALLTFAPRPWYATYTATAPLWGLSALEDQQLAGAIMWVPMSFAYIVAAMRLLYAWLQDMEQSNGRVPKRAS